VSPAKRKHFTDKRKLFAREYARDLNGTQAAIRAGFAPSSANRRAYEMLREPEITAMVHKCLDAACARADVNADRVIKELARVAFADPAAAVRVDRGRVRVADTDQLTVDQRAAIAEVSETERGIRVKLQDKVRALELLGKYLAMWTDRTEHAGEVRVVYEEPKWQESSESASAPTPASSP
jgi:phage terminase small subunit